MYSLIPLRGGSSSLLRWHKRCRGARYILFAAQSTSSPSDTLAKVIFLRHGQSIWNKIPTFSGWCDVPLTELGREQARGAGRVMCEKRYALDLVFTSTLSRAYKTAEVVLEEMGNETAPTIRAWELNERHYGALQGLAKDSPELIQKHGKEQLRAWRREMTATPPPMDESHPHWAPSPAPLTESLLDTQNRVIRYWHDTIVPAMRPTGRTVLIAAHANTIRSLIAYLDDLSHDDVPSIHVPNSVPCLYNIETTTGLAVQKDSSPLSKSKGYWILSQENQERLVEKLGGDSESFARSLFTSWDSNSDGVLSKNEILQGLSAWRRENHTNPAIKALSAKLFEELVTSDEHFEDMTLEQFQHLAVKGSRKHNLPFFSEEIVESTKQIEMAVPGMSGKIGTKNEQFRSLTPHRSATVPLLVDDNTSLVLSESPAIMTYLCERYGAYDGQQLYAPPGSNQKALIDSYMHWHHDNTRFLAKLFQTKVRPDLKVTMNDQDNTRIRQVLESIDEGWLQSSLYIGKSETPSIADILAYGEISTVTMTNLLVVNEFENLSSWMKRMVQLPYHDECHLALTTLGDLSIDSDVPIAKQLGPATKAGLKALADAQQ